MFSSMPQIPEIDTSRLKKKGTTSPSTSVLRKKPNAEEEDKTDLSDYVAMFVRGASGFTPGGLIGAAAGGGGELLAQTIENPNRLFGNDKYNLPQVGTQAALGAIPFGSAMRLGRSIAKGAVLGAGGTVATQQAEEGLHVPRTEELPMVALGATIGGAGGGIGSKLYGRRLEKSLSEATGRRFGFEPPKPVKAPIIPKVDIPTQEQPEVKLPGRETRILSQQGPEVGRQIIKSVEEPQAAKTDKGVKIGADIESLGKILGSSLYKGNITKIATKELLQNSIDATRHLGPNANVRVIFSRVKDNNYVEVVDNGRGLSKQELETVFTDLGSSGKRSDVTAIGGFGLAKAAPLLGGKKVEVNSVVDTPRGKVMYSFSGTPDELIKGVKINEAPVAPDTPTGVKVRTYVPEDGDFWGADRFVKKMAKYSDLPGTVDVATKYSEDYTPTPDTYGKEKPVMRLLTEIDDPHTTYTISVPESEPKVTTPAINLQLLNQGMWQAERALYFPSSIPNVPQNIVINIKSKVPEGDPNYPFTANREEIRGDIETSIKKFIDENLVNPSLHKRKDELKRLYESMPEMPITGHGVARSFHIYDSGNRMAPEELVEFMGNEYSQQLSITMRSAIENMLDTIGEQTWSDRLERVGMIFDEGLRGIHIPNPETGKSIIMINPWSTIKKFPDDPDNAAGGILHTILHEMAHIDKIMGSGHNEDFAINLANIYEKVGRRKINEFQDKIFDSIVDPTGQSYHPEIQRLLQIYTDSRGRAVTGEDLLTGTGIGSVSSRGRAGSIPSRRRSDPTGITGTDVANLPKATAASGDLSAPFRQGLFLVGRKQWWQSWIPMLQSLREGNYDRIVQEMESHPRFEEAMENGLAYTNGSSAEEQFASKLARNIPILGPYLIQPSERAYTTFLNNLRLSLYDDLMNKAERLNKPVNPQTLSKYINSATGRGGMGLTVTGSSSTLEGAARGLNALFFSPRFILSRIQLLNPASYVKMDPFTRKEALRDLATLTGVAGSILKLAELNGAEVEWNPSKPEFGKIKIGDTRIDIMGGFSQYIRFFTQIAKGLATEQKGPNVWRFIESKLSPTARFMLENARGTDYFGKKVSIPQSAMNAFVPMITRDVYDLWKEDPNLVPLAGLPAIGVSVQTYGEGKRVGTRSGMPQVNLPKLPSL